MSALKQQHLHTELIVFGYMNRIQALFASQTNSCYTMPNDIVFLTLSYLKNYFKNDGIYKWKIENKQTVHQMLTAKCGDKFESDPFIIARLPWRFEIYPNGDKPELTGYFVIYLRLLSLPSNVDKVVIHRIFRVMENMAASSWTFKLSEGEYAYWTRKCPLSELIELKCKTITIQAQIAVNKIILKEKDETVLSHNLITQQLFPSNAKIIYKFNGNELKLFKQSQICKEMVCGDIVDNMWCLTICPNGKNDEFHGAVGVYVHLCRLPQRVKELKDKVTIRCVENSEHLHFTVNGSTQMTGFGCHAFINIQDVMDLDQVTFIVDIEILNVEFQQEADINLLEISDTLQITQILSGYSWNTQK